MDTGLIFVFIILSFYLLLSFSVVKAFCSASYSHKCQKEFVIKQFISFLIVRSPEPLLQAFTLKGSKLIVACTCLNNSIVISLNQFIDFKGKHTYLLWICTTFLYPQTIEKYLYYAYIMHSGSIWMLLLNNDEMYCIYLQYFHFLILPLNFGGKYFTFYSTEFKFQVTV